MVVLHITMSLDGYVAGPDVGPGRPMGREGERLHDWLFRTDDEIAAAQAREARASTGAAVIGRTMFDLGRRFWDGTPYPVPTFVVTHEARDPLPTRTGSFTFVDGVAAAVEQACAAAGDRDVTVMGGAEVARQALRAGVVDELHLDVAHVLLGGGLRLFEDLGVRTLERRALAGSSLTTHLRLSWPS